MIQLNEIIAERTSCRNFRLQKMNIDKIQALIESARWAPSGKNGQPWRFVVVINENIKKAIALNSVYGNWMKNASAFIIVYLDKGKSYDYIKDLQGIGAAIQNILLQATYMGIGTCWIGEILRNEAKINSLLQVPDNYELMAVICVGYANESTVKTQRINIQDIIYKEI